MKKITEVRAPVRIDFGGGTTDIHPFTHLYGGAVVNVAISPHVYGRILRSDNKVGLEYSADIPTSSGLGTSAAMTLVWLALISDYKKFNKKIKTELAERVYEIDNIFGGVNGKQDQYAAAFGGINFMEFHNKEVKVTPLKLGKKFIKELQNNLVLVYTGKTHLSSSTNKRSIENLKAGKNNKNLLKIKAIAQEIKSALLKRDLNKFKNLLNEETIERAKLHKQMVPPHVRNFIRLGMRNGGKAAKICGSGNGGSILFLGNKEKLKEKFKKKVIDFKFDFTGLKRV